MEALVSYCNAMSYHKPDIHPVYVGEKLGQKTEAEILQIAARQINWDGSLRPEEMGEMEIIGYRPCVD